jgi:hypothetical protein
MQADIICGAGIGREEITIIETGKNRFPKVIFSLFFVPLIKINSFDYFFPENPTYV